MRGFGLFAAMWVAAGCAAAVPPVADVAATADVPSRQAEVAALLDGELQEAVGGPLPVVADAANLPDIRRDTVVGGPVRDTAVAAAVAQCTQPAECGAGSTCVQGACLPVLCVPALRVCSSASSAAICLESGTDWIPEPCPAGYPCQGGACLAVGACLPGDVTCADGATLSVCDPAGTFRQALPCPSKHKCLDGQCWRGDQAPGEPDYYNFCMGGLWGGCSKANQPCWVAPCGAGKTCIGGKCTAQVCVPGAAWCQGPQRNVCHGTGSKWLTEACPQGTVCWQGGCVAQTCPPGAIGCDGADRAVCPAAGGPWQQLPCPSGQACSKGVCKPKLCAPGYAWCENGQLATCDATGTGVGYAACPTGQTCHAGICKPTLCDPATPACFSDKAIAVCNDAGTAVSPKDCYDDGCLQGACVPKTCKPDAVQCDNNDRVTVCNGNGTKLSVLQDCKTQTPPTICVDGGCLPATCAPQLSVCTQGNKLATCAKSGAGYTVTACKPLGVCVNGACTSPGCKWGQEQCFGGEVIGCDDAGQPFVKSACDGSKSACAVTQGGIVYCHSKQCDKIGVDHCHSDDTIWTCTTSTTSESEKQKCAAFATCETTGNSVACKPIVCSEGHSCDPANPFVAQSCAWPYTVLKQAFCDPGLVCMPGYSGALQCQPPACEPKSRFCFDTTPMYCNASGSAAEAGKACATGTTCFGGQCLGTPCIAGALACAGSTTVTSCGANGQWQTTPCPPGWGCDSGVCQPQVCSPGKTYCGPYLSVRKCNAGGTASHQVGSCDNQAPCADGKCEYKGYKWDCK